MNINLILNLHCKLNIRCHKCCQKVSVQVCISIRIEVYCTTHDPKFIATSLSCTFNFSQKYKDLKEMNVIFKLQNMRKNYFLTNLQYSNYANVSI